MDLADPDSWPVVDEDFRQRIEAGHPDVVVFIHNAGTLTPLGSADRVDTDVQAELGASSPDEIPASTGFRELEALGKLSKPETVARIIWPLLDRDLESGTVLHVRDLT